LHTGILISPDRERPNPKNVGPYFGFGSLTL
jgi:hypothetical protein